MPEPGERSRTIIEAITGQLVRLIVNGHYNSGDVLSVAFPPDVVQARDIEAEDWSLTV